MSKRVYDWDSLEIGGALQFTVKKPTYKRIVTMRQTLLRSAAYYASRGHPGFKVKTRQIGNCVEAERVA